MEHFPIDIKSVTFFFKHIDTFIRYKDVILADKDLSSITVYGMCAYIAWGGIDEFNIGKLLRLYDDKVYHVLGRKVASTFNKEDDIFYLVQLKASILSGL